MDFNNLIINGKEYSVPNDMTILEACRYVGIRIPTLCWLKDVNEIGACRICVVELKGAKSLVASCVYPVSEIRPGSEIFTNSPAVIESRKTTLQLILSTHEKKCLACVRSGNCELQALCKEYGIDDVSRFDGVREEYPVDLSASHLVRDDNKCILCRRCTAVCSKIQSIGVIGPNERGFKTHIGSAFEAGLGDVACISCGQCINVCPTGALRENDETDRVFAALNDPKKHVVVQTAPSIRVALGEEFGMPIGTIVTGKMVSALKMLGFDGVFDTNFTADLTIMEEAHEFLQRFTANDRLPMITSCCPGWIKYCEHYHHDMLPHLSTCKSPQRMFGSVIRTYYAETMGIDPADIFVVSVMPCTAKKFEARRNKHDAVSGLPDIDVAITTRELARMIKKQGIMFESLPDGEFDKPFGLGSGAGTIFGATGGVMEAALRTAAIKYLGVKLPSIDLEQVRGVKGIKEAEFELAGNKVRVAVVSGIANARTILDAVRNGEKHYDFIEIMACPGGCVNGGGQPIQPAQVRNFTDISSIRAKALYEDDLSLKVRLSHENENIKTIYSEYFGEPGSHLAHKLLHTAYTEREKY